jgi:hypothetical protein
MAETNTALGDEPKEATVFTCYCHSTYIIDVLMCEGDRAVVTLRVIDFKSRNWSKTAMTQQASRKMQRKNEEECKR